MAIEMSITDIVLSDDSTEVTIFVTDGEHAPYNFARIFIPVENRDRLLSEIKTEAIRKAKAFLLQVASSLPD